MFFFVKKTPLLCWSEQPPFDTTIIKKMSTENQQLPNNEVSEMVASKLDTIIQRRHDGAFLFNHLTEYKALRDLF